MISSLLSRFAGPLVLVLLVLVGVASVGWGIEHRNAAKLSTTVVEQKCQLTDAAASQQLTDKSAAITEKSEVQTIHTVTQLVVDQKAMDDEVSRRVSEIKQQYATQPPTPENTRARDDAVSGAQLDGLWNAYCSSTGNQNQAGCTK